MSNIIDKPGIYNKFQFRKIMKLKKISLNQISEANLNEREMCRLLGGGTPGCCQCGCHYAGTPGGASTSANTSANNAEGKYSDYQPQCSGCSCSSYPPLPRPLHETPSCYNPQSTTCGYF